ncbi:MAG: hypothetical protein HZA78_13045 [Candidatus Schekmanbacteria bacterium]|nr:hypothetical protein [Candidatus Schekmanbacteria bacterium]
MRIRSYLEIFILSISLLSITGCAILTDLFSGEDPYTYAIKGADVEEAMVKAERTAMAMGFYVAKLDKQRGEMNAGRKLGGGLIEDTGLNFILSRGENGQLFFTLYVDTTAKDKEKIIHEFVEEYGRYVKIIDPRKKGKADKR